MTRQCCISYIFIQSDYYNHGLKTEGAGNKLSINEHTNMHVHLYRTGTQAIYLTGLNCTLTDTSQSDTYHKPVPPNHELLTINWYSDRYCSVGGIMVMVGSPELVVVSLVMNLASRIGLLVLTQALPRIVRGITVPARDSVNCNMGEK